MKILFLSQRFLFPMDTGGKIRTGNILKQLSRHHEITLISNVESPKDDPWLSQIPSLCAKFIPVPWKEIPKHSPLFLIRLFFQMFSIYPVNVLNDYSRPLTAAVTREYRRGIYDVAVCDFVQSALMFRGLKGIPSVLFQHNVESMIAKRHLNRSHNPLTKIFWFLQWKKMMRFEKNACHFFDTVIAVSEQDKVLFEQLYGAHNVRTIPTGVDTEFFCPMPDIPVYDNSLVFCGSMDWLPNEDAILFFIREILPHIQRKLPNITLTVVGRNPSPAMKAAVKDYPQVILTGWVDDTRPYIARSAVVIIPIRIGGGTRMKIYEAMAMGKAVVSTSVGAEGLPVINGEHIFIEDDPVQFSAKIVHLLTSIHDRERLGASACEFVRKNFAWERIGEAFGAICQMTSQKPIIK